MKLQQAVIEIKNDIAYSFLHNLEQMKVLRIVSREGTSKKRTMAEAIAECDGHTVDEFIGELKRQLDEHYEKA